MEGDEVRIDDVLTYSAKRNSCDDFWTIDYLHSAIITPLHGFQWRMETRPNEWNNLQRLLAILNSEALKCRAWRLACWNGFNRSDLLTSAGGFDKIDSLQSCQDSIITCKPCSKWRVTKRSNGMKQIDPWKMKNKLTYIAVRLNWYLSSCIRLMPQNTRNKLERKIE